MKKIKYAVGSVAQAAAEGADSLLSEARKDVVAARGPERTTPIEVEEMAEAVSKTKGSAESEAPEVKMENMKDTTKLVNSFSFQGGNKKMDKQFIMESLNEVADTPIIESKQSIAEFITDLHRTQLDEESKPLLASDDFKKLNIFASDEEREAKNEGGEMGDSDVDKLIMFTKQYKKELAAAENEKQKERINKRFEEIEDSFDSNTRFDAMVKMNQDEGSEPLTEEEKRESFGIGSIAKKVSKAVQKEVKDIKDLEDVKVAEENVKSRKKYAPRRSSKDIAADEEARDYRGGEVTPFKLGMSEEDKNRKLKRSQIPEGPYEFRKAFREAWKAKEETFMYDGKEYKVSEEILPGRKKYDEGGSLLDDSKPVDTYDNIPDDEKAEVAASQLPDDKMEEEYAEYVMDESLEMSEQEYLLKALEGDERLGEIFDKIMDTAGEFAGEGAVKGPGTGTSDSIPARLSDGEFVFTRKATDQIGTEKLQTMMDDAERAYDGGLMKKYGGGGVMSGLMEMQDPDMGVHNQMLKANAMPSVRKR